MTAERDRLHIDAPKGTISPELKAGLAQHKAELLALLGSPPTPAAEPVISAPAPAWAGVTMRLEDLADFKARWGLELLAIDWPPGGGPALGTFAPAGEG